MHFSLLQAARECEERYLINSTTSLMKSFYANGILRDCFLQGYFDIAQALKPRTLKYLPMLGRGYQFVEVKELHWWEKRFGQILNALWKL